MEWTLPGTVLEVDPSRPEAAREILGSLFTAGGLVLSQVCQLTGLEPYTVQNWVKRGFLPPPEKKKYSCRQLCRIIFINMLRMELPMESICKLLSYVNGQLNDESDDIIDDSQMYFIFTRVASACGNQWPPENPGAFLDRELQAYDAPNPEARARVKDALAVMLTAWYASQLRKQAAKRLARLGL